MNVDVKEPADTFCAVGSEPLPCKNGVADIVEADNLLEHLTNDQFRMAMNDVWRVLKRGGVFWIKVPDAEHWIAGAIGDPDHRMLFCERTFIYFDKNHGTHKQYGTQFKGWSSISVKTDKKFIEATLVK